MRAASLPLHACKISSTRVECKTPAASLQACSSTGSARAGMLRDCLGIACDTVSQPLSASQRDWPTRLLHAAVRETGIAWHPSSWQQATRAWLAPQGRTAADLALSTKSHTRRKLLCVRACVRACVCVCACVRACASCVRAFVHTNASWPASMAS
jgi:hypothetical protein